MNELIGIGITIGYYLVFCFLLPTALRVFARVPMEWVRKTQHVAFSLSIFLLLRLFSAWYFAVAAGGVFLLLVYPVLIVIERSGWYQRVLTDRTTRGGELRRQLVYVQLSFAMLMVIYWGLLGAKWQYVVAVAVMAWGFGDAAAALVGKAVGRRRFLHRWIEGAKTKEGTAAMMIVAGTALFWTMLCYGGKPWYVSLIVAMVVAPVCGVVELFSKRGTDTLTVPLSAAAVIVPLMYLLSLVGG